MILTRASLLAFATLCAAPLLAADAAGAKDPLTTREELREVFRQTPSAARGSKLFTACIACHGKDGNGQPQGDVPAIAQQHQRVIAKQLVDYRHAERWDLKMEEVASTHRLGPPRDIADLAAFVSTLSREAKEGNGDGRNVEHGGRVYLRDCSGCHGAEGEGNGVTLVPRLAGQHYRYLLRQLHDTLEERRPNMPPPHPQLFEKFAVEDFTGIADYLSRLKPARRVLSTP
jgi:cytochrome c553